MHHVLLRDRRLKGWEHGMLRALEAEIIRQTNAEVIEIPEYGRNPIVRRAGHGMRLDAFRSMLPKRTLKIDCDVIWCVLMGPEDHILDLFRDWNIKARYRVIYLFDTLPPQFELIKKLYSNDIFNIRITSFGDALPDLESLTGKKWFAIEQAVPEDLFTPVPTEQRLIHFSSYGRRFPDFHQALIAFCKANGLYYDFTTHDAKHPTAPEDDLYRQYAWHLSHSLFTISWPVELTSPQRAGKLRPITCRWFEAAAGATCILGRKPDNKAFDDILHPDLVQDIDPHASPATITKQLESIWSSRDELAQRAKVIKEANGQRWSWKNRVNRMLELIK